MSEPAQRLVPVAGAHDRADDVRAMFDRLAPRYDLANRVLSLGLDQWWRKQALDQLEGRITGQMLDLCAGTLDLTRALLDRGAAHVHAADFSQAMLDAGRGKFAADAPVSLSCCDARNLPFEDGQFDGIIAGFGLRNVPEVHKALAECARVLRPGGRLVVLDFFQPTTVTAKVLQGSYNTVVLPVVGGLVTGYAAAYRYLSQSIEAWCTRQEFEAMLADQGLAPWGKELLPPVASLITGTKAQP